MEIHKAGNYKVISPQTLKEIAPSAFKAWESLDPSYQDPIWIITQKPQPVESSAETDDDGSVFYSEWSETNEPELAEWLAEEWETATITVDGERIVVLCGTMDDEYGNFWDNSKGEWVNYMF